MIADMGKTREKGTPGCGDARGHKRGHWEAAGTETGTDGTERGTDGAWPDGTETGTERAAAAAERQRVKRVSVRMTVGEYHAMAMLARRGGFGTIAAFLRSAAFVLLHDLRLAADGYVPSRLRDTAPDDIEGEVEAMFRECEDGGWGGWPADINGRR